MTTKYFLAEVCLVEGVNESGGMKTGYVAELFAEGITSLCHISFADSQITLGDFKPNETRVVSIGIEYDDLRPNDGVVLYQNKPFLIKSPVLGMVIAYGRVVSERGW